MSIRTILISKADLERLKSLLASARKFLRHCSPEHLCALEEGLEQAEVITEGKIPANVVTMNRQARVLDLDAGKKFEYVLVFPRDADVAKGRISVLAPIGAAMLGGRVGEVIEGRVPAGIRRFKIEEVKPLAESRGAAA
ncbi:MAG: GreA/GreB family elongation factor [Chlamydiota bacterium]